MAFYVAAHNAEIPHSAFRGQTPDQMYYGRGHGIPEQLRGGEEESSRGAGPGQSSGIVRGLPGGEPDDRGDARGGVRVRQRARC